MTKRFKIFKNTIGAVLILLGILIISNIYKPIDDSEYEPRDEDLLTLTNYLIEDPKYQKGTGRSRTFFKLTLNSYPGANFENEYEFLQATSWTSALSSINYHDTVTIKVLKRKFEKFYLHKDSLSFFEQLLFYPTDRFEFFSLRCKEKEYINDLLQAAKAYKNERSVSSFVIGLMFIGMGVYSLLAKK